MSNPSAFPYPGGKGRYADWIIDHFPDHECYVETVDAIDGYWVLSYDKLPEPLPEYEHIVERITKNRVSNGQEEGSPERYERLLMNYDPEAVPRWSPGVGNVLEDDW